MDNIRIETVLTPVTVGYAEFKGYSEFNSPTLESFNSTLSASTLSECIKAEPYDGSALKTFEEFKQMVDEQRSTPEYLLRTFNYLIEEIGKLTDKIKEKGLENEQWALDGMDILNKISVKF